MIIKKYVTVLFVTMLISVLLFSCNTEHGNMEDNSTDAISQSEENTTNMNTEKLPYKKLWVNTTFTDHMVLQRGEPVRIYGHGGNPGDLVTVTFDGKTYKGIVGEDEWEVWLDTMDACKEGKTLTVSHEGREVSFDDVVVGEVWLCSGQSNMGVNVDYILKKDANVREDYSEYNNWENIRIFDRQVVLSEKPVRQVAGSEVWQVVDSFEDVIPYTAAGVAFGSNLSHMLGDDIPVGILHCSVGGSPIQAWISEEGLKSLNLEYVSDDIRTYVEQWEYRCYNGMLYNVMGYTYKGMFWYQGCGNSHHTTIEYYRPMFELFREELSAATGNRDFPILVMQLVQHNDPVSWAAIRQVQWDLMELDSVYTICGIDLGHKTDSVSEAAELDTIHPTDKWAVGKRVAGVALKEVYGLEAPTDGNPYGLSPTIDKAIFKDGVVHVSITDNVTLTPSEGKIGGFEARLGTQWVAVESEFINNEFIVHIDKLYKVPKVIRYMGTNVIPEGIAYLYNEYGLPLAPDAEIAIEGID